MKVPVKVISDDSPSELSELSKELKERREFLCNYLEYGAVPLESRLSVPMVTRDELRLLLVEAGYVELISKLPFPHQYDDNCQIHKSFKTRGTILYPCS